MSVARRISRDEQAKLYEQEMGAEALAREKRAAAKKCSSCHQPIRWGITGNHRRMPLDYDENEAANVFLFADGSCKVGRQEDETPVGATRHFSHFATCKFAAEHRKGR